MKLKSAIALAIYGWKQTNPGHRSSTQHTFTSQPVGPEPGHDLDGFSAKGISQAAVKVLAGLGSYLRAHQRRLSLHAHEWHCCSVQILGDLCFSLSAGLRQLATKVCSTESGKMEVTFFHNLLTEVTSHYFG